jgi:hypothetical protein
MGKGKINSPNNNAALAAQKSFPSGVTLAKNNSAQGNTVQNILATSKQILPQAKQT